MRAVICRAWGAVDDLVVDDVAPPAPGPGQLLIDVEATGVNYADAIMVAGRYQTKPPLPFRPGRETAGVSPAAATASPHRPGSRDGDPRLRRIRRAGCVADEVETFRVPSGCRRRGGAFPIAYNLQSRGHPLAGRLEAGETMLGLGAAGGRGHGGRDRHRRWARG